VKTDHDQRATTTGRALDKAIAALDGTHKFAVRFTHFVRTITMHGEAIQTVAPTHKAIKFAVILSPKINGVGKRLVHN
jgi:hypothetical protein